MNINSFGYTYRILAPENETPFVPISLLSVFFAAYYVYTRKWESDSLSGTRAGIGFTPNPSVLTRSVMCAYVVGVCRAWVKVRVENTDQVQTTIFLSLSTSIVAADF